MMPEETIVEIENDGDRIKISRMWCGCGSCFNLKIEATPEDEETTVIETYSDFDDIKSGVIARLAWEVDALQKQDKTHALQARIDALMIEYCPEEMTVSQRDEWARNQVATEDK